MISSSFQAAEALWTVVSYMEVEGKEDEGPSSVQNRGIVSLATPARPVPLATVPLATSLLGLFMVALFNALDDAPTLIWLNGSHRSVILLAPIDLRLTPQESPPVPPVNSAPAVEEEVLVDKQAIAKLTEGLLSHYLPDLQNSKQVLQELTSVFPGQVTIDLPFNTQASFFVLCIISCFVLFLLTRQNQVILLDTLDQEVTKFRECNTLLDLSSLVKLYAC